MTSAIRARLSRTKLRYALVSVISVTIGQLTLVALFYFAHWSARPANVGSVIAGGIPSYYLNRRWAWGKTGKHSLGREVGPFWAMTFAGFVVSTWLAGMAGDFGEDHFTSRGLLTVCVAAASLLAFGGLWVLKFLAFDRLMFSRASADQHGAR